jgi:hypothetical protein
LNQQHQRVVDVTERVIANQTASLMADGNFERHAHACQRLRANGIKDYHDYPWRRLHRLAGAASHHEEKQEANKH